MSSSKKSLLAKLKKDIQVKKKTSVVITPSSSDDLHLRIETSEDVVVPAPPSSQERHLDFLRKLEIKFQENASRQDIQDTVRLHLSYFPDDQTLSRLLLLDVNQCKDFISSSMTNPEKNVLTELKAFTSAIQSSKTQDEFEVLKSKLSSLSEKTFQAFVEVDPFVFEDLSFQPAHNTFLVMGLMDTILALPPTTTPSQVKHTVQQYMYNHRYDYALTYLQNPEISEEEKDAFVHTSIRHEFENVRSQHLYFQIMNLIDEKTSAFQKPLQSILFRCVPDKLMIPSLKNFLEVMLDVIINQVSGKSLEKYFTSKAKLESFRQKFLPSLSSRETYSALIHNRCVEEFDQSYLYKNAKRIHFQTYLESIQKQVNNPLISVELDLYEHLRKNTQQKLHQMLTLLNQETINRTNLNVLLQQFIVTRPYKEQTELQKLTTATFPTIKNVLLKYEAQDYLQALKDMSTLQQDRDVLLREPTKINYMEVVNDTTEMIERTRPYLLDFDHIAISPMDDIAMYILRPDHDSTTFFIPNELFYQHLMDESIPKSQLKNVFVLGKRKMTLANVNISNDYLIQDQETFYKGVSYIQQQKKMETISGPIPYFLQFCTTPVLNHQSQFMQSLREKNRTLLSSYLLKCEISNERTDACVMEQSIYDASENLGQYAHSLSIVLTLLSSTTSSLSMYTNHFKNLLRTRQLVLSHLGELLTYNNDAILETLFPEALHAKEGSDILEGMFLQDTALCKRRIVMDAYTRQFPMRRVPYLPVNPSLRSFRTDRVVLDDDQTYDMPESMHKFFQAPSEDVMDVMDVMDVVISTEQVDIITENVDEVPERVDPLESFLEVAFDELNNL